MSYLKCYPALGTLNLRRSFANNVPEEGVQFYHIDPNSPRFLKFFTDLIIADTTGLHKGSKCKRKDRTMLTINYVIHPEEFKPPTFNMRVEDYNNLPDYKKPLCDFLNKKV